MNNSDIFGILYAIIILLMMIPILHFSSFQNRAKTREEEIRRIGMYWGIKKNRRIYYYLMSYIPISFIFSILLSTTFLMIIGVVFFHLISSLFIGLLAYLFYLSNLSFVEKKQEELTKLEK